MVRSADRVITCSHYMRSHVASVFGVAPRRITVIQNGIDARDLEPVDADLDALRAQFAGPDERLVLLVGRLVYEKGFHLALDALAPVIRRLGGVRFVVAGTGTAEAELKRQARRLGLMRHGTFLGWVGDDMLHSLYRVADLCIVPSIYEPFGLVALEAMASGCLCVVADTGGLREVVPDDGTVGLRFPAHDSVALGTILERVLTDDAAREQLVAEAREHVLRFDWDEVARQTRGVYAAMTSGRAATEHQARA
jgi:glycogen synthase